MNKSINFFLFFLIFSLFSSVFAQNSQNTRNSQTSRGTESGQNAQISSTAQDVDRSLLITPHDIKITAQKDATGKTLGYHLYVNKKEKIESIMLTETTKDPTGQEASYSYRALEYNSINGDERRILNGQELNSEISRYFLIDSTTEKNEFFDECFHIYIPEQIEYGYEWSRNGVITIGKGTFINIRAFEKKYCDYTGLYSDNPFMFDFNIKKEKVAKKVVEKPRVEKPVAEKPLAKPRKDIAKKIDEKPLEDDVVLTDDYNPLAAHSFDELSDFMIYSKGPETIIDDIMTALDNIEDKNICDVVFAIDATGSMKDDIDMLKNEWVPSLLEGLKEFNDIRLGLVFYRDYGDNFYTNSLPVKCFGFTSDVDKFIKSLKSVRIIGTEGGDIPEAVYEALYASMEFFAWRGDASKKIILIGDAEPHPTPRRSGKYSKKLIEELSIKKDIAINAIITPDEKSRRGR